MSRALKVPRHQALQAAMLLFWSQGYHATSVDQLQAAMGLQRGSFYYLFKDKRRLFLEVVAAYKNSVVERRRTLVQGASSPSNGVRLFFQDILEHSLSTLVYPGCLNTNSAIELGLFDQEISSQLESGIQTWEAFWVETLTRCQALGEIEAKSDIHAKAGLLIALTQGLNVLFKVHRDRAFLQSVIDSGLDFLPASSRVTVTQK